MTELALGGPDLLDPGAVGHKFARQEALRRAGFPVPEFFCVPAEVFDLILARAGGLPTPLPDWSSRAAVTQWSAAAKAAIEAAGMPPDLAISVAAAFDGLVGPHALAAVRACVVAGADGVAEDSAVDPFAGLSDSYLYVNGTDLLARVQSCWASAFNPAALLYRNRRGVSPVGARVAVGIQRMIMGARSFVAFSKDPRDGAEHCVIAAAHGIGEGVVQENADVDHFTVDPAGQVAGRLVRKTRMVALDLAAPTPVPGVLPVPPELADQPVLSDAEARQLAELAAAVERHFGCPQDIEGTIAPDGAIWLVQARPMQTTSGRVTPAAPPGSATPGARSGLRGPASSAASGERDEDATQVIPWSNHNVTESFPGVTSSLTFSVALDFYELIFGDAYRRLGVPSRRLRRNQHHLRRMIGYLDGRVYYRMDAWYALHSQVPAFDLIRPEWAKGMGLPEGVRTTAPPAARLFGHRRVSWRLMGSLPGLAVRLVRHPWSVRRFVRWWDGEAARNADLAGRSVDELIATYRRIWSEVAVRWGVTLVNGLFLYAAMRVTRPLLDRWAAGGGHDLLTGLLCGGEENRSAAALRSAVALAERVSVNADLRVAMLREPDQQVWAALVAGRYGPDIGEAARLHLRRYGDRAMSDLKLEVLTPRQQPWTVLRTLRPFVRQGLTVEDNRAAERRARRRAERDLRSRCPNPVRRAVLHALLNGLRWLTRVREDTRFCRTQLFGISREVMWRLGAALAEAGRLDEAADIVDLTAAEVIGAFDGTLPGTDLRGLVLQRRGERLRSAATAGPPARLTTPAGIPVAAVPTGAGRTAAQLGAAERIVAGADAMPETGVSTAAAVPAATGGDGERRAEPGDGPSTELRGLASSGGRVRARAKVVLDPSISPDECADSILVARETDPGWLYLMLAAKALVVERGTLLSHTAITGRILGIPTVVSVENATELIRDGAWIEVDGTAGTVRLLEGPEGED